MKYSIIVPVFNRPDEVDELLESLCSQTLKDFELRSNSVTTRQSTDKSDSALAAPSFEVVIVEDGSEKTCKDVCDKYANILDLHYYYKENSGPGQSRNYGVERAHGEYVIILDSDVVLPEGYLMAINSQLSTNMLGRSRRFSSLFYSRAESHLLLDDLLFHYRGNTGRQEETRQVLSPFLQYGYPPGCLPATGRFL